MFWISNLCCVLLKNIGFVPWWDIMLSQTQIYYWQEIFLFTLVSNSESILSWYHFIVCELNRTIECVVNLNVMWLGFVFIFNSFIHMMVQLLFHSLLERVTGGGVCLKLDVQGQGGGTILNVDRQAGWGSWKLDNCYGCHMCIVPYVRTRIFKDF